MSPAPELRIGVVGYSATPFDAKAAHSALVTLLNRVLTQHPHAHVTLVSGLTDLGIPALAYREAARRGWRTEGFACAKATEFERYPVDEEHLIGADWGDESHAFLASVDVLVRIGGGPQAQREYDAFTGPKHAIEL